MPLRTKPLSSFLPKDPVKLHKLEAKFWSKVDNTTDPSGCWPWTGRQNQFGYGAFCIRVRDFGAHRLAVWFDRGEEAGHGELDATMHTCDNRICCNPSHLRVCTNYENIMDSTLKGRKTFKLTTEQALEIRRLYAEEGKTQTELAKLFGVTQPTISYFCAGMKRNGIVAPPIPNKATERRRATCESDRAMVVALAQQRLPYAEIVARTGICRGQVAKLLQGTHYLHRPKLWWKQIQADAQADFDAGMSRADVCRKYELHYQRSYLVFGKPTTEEK